MVFRDDLVPAHGASPTRAARRTGSCRAALSSTRNAVAPDARRSRLLCWSRSLLAASPMTGSARMFPRSLLGTLGGAAVLVARLRRPRAVDAALAGFTFARPSPLAAALLAMGALAFAPTLAWLFAEYTHTIWRNGYGLFVPFFMILLARHTLRRDSSAEEESCAWGFAFLLPGLALAVLDAGVVPIISGDRVGARVAGPVAAPARRAAHAHDRCPARARGLPRPLPTSLERFIGLAEASAALARPLIALFDFPVIWNQTLVHLPGNPYLDQPELQRRVHAVRGDRVRHDGGGHCALARAPVAPAAGGLSRGGRRQRAALSGHPAGLVPATSCIRPSTASRGSPFRGRARPDLAVCGPQGPPRGALVIPVARRFSLAALALFAIAAVPIWLHRHGRDRSLLASEQLRRLAAFGEALPSRDRRTEASIHELWVGGRLPPFARGRPLRFRVVRGVDPSAFYGDLQRYFYHSPLPEDLREIRALEGRIGSAAGAPPERLLHRAAQGDAILLRQGLQPVTHPLRGGLSLALDQLVRGTQPVRCS